MIKLYHIQAEGDPFGGSRNGCKAVIALEEMGVDYEVSALDRMADCRPADAPYRQINPNGVTPTIDDNGFILWESGAILQYLADANPSSGLLPTDLKKRATVQQWVAWEGASFAPALLNFFFAMTAPEPDEATVATTKEAFLGALGILNNQLAGKDYISGDYSIADIAIGAVTSLSFLLGLDLTPYPNILAWLARLRDKPSWQAAAAVMADMEAGKEQIG
ncbi:MAG: glutathione S-transferase family protein [Cycloclasticus sp.]|jgi:glutathione S-transferase|nr:MAG: glutathione S-transferase [Cycloclasticus sp. Phe_18]MBV1913732.1 glutathione S-transferase family protein [Cycloclasticus sp.]MEE4290298.1 glutathione S-transferase family protein [Cycloclasticus sp.]